MPDTLRVAAQYASGALLGQIREALGREGLRPPLSLDDLAKLDEFHVGGRLATEGLARNLRISAGCRVLDLGCGLGGPARYIAKATGARVTGIDLTADFIEVGRELTGMALMVDLVDLIYGDIARLPYVEAQFDAAVMMHVGMNIADKGAVFDEVARVLRPGAKFGIYDVMSVAEEAPRFPLPWARSAEYSHLASPQSYRDTLVASGFEIISEIDRSVFAKAFFEHMAAREKAAGGPPPLGLHLVMGADTEVKIANLVTALTAGQVAPVEIIARLPE